MFKTKIITIGSSSALDGFKDTYSYCGSKHALLGIIKSLNKTNCELIHCDVMDGNFVPNISFGPDIIKNIKKNSKKIIDVHLMINNVANNFIYVILSFIYI